MRSMIARKRRIGRMQEMLLVLSSALAVAAVAVAGAQATAAVAPQSSSQPTISGRLQQGHTLTAHNGIWSSSPTSFTYQWQQCDGSGASCNPISGATSRSYTAASGDVDHTLRVVVTASNADGSSSATSQATGAISSASAPVNTAAPQLSGTPRVGEQLSATAGSWTGGATSFAYQWQRCDKNGGACVSVADATAKVYGVGSIDAGNTLRVVVTATNRAGSTNATSSATSLVASISTPVATHNHAPTVRFLSLRRVGHRVYARFSLCDDSPKNVAVVETDHMAGRLGYTHRFSIAAQPCGTHARNWVLIPRLRHAGLFTATLHAVDTSGASSRTVSRTIRFHAV
jgi:hypothetical protein